MNKYPKLENILNTPAHIGKRNERITCRDGQSVSIQTGEALYCSPRTNSPGWHEVEAGYPSCVPPLSWKQYAEEWHKTFAEKWSSFINMMKFSAEADYRYSKSGNKYINYLKGARRGFRRDWRNLWGKQPCNTIYPYLPVELVKEFIDVHGGEVDK